MKSISTFRFVGTGFFLIYLMTYIYQVGGNAWERAGCHKVGKSSINMQIKTNLWSFIGN